MDPIFEGLHIQEKYTEVRKVVLLSKNGWKVCGCTKGVKVKDLF